MISPLLQTNCIHIPNPGYSCSYCSTLQQPQKPYFWNLDVVPEQENANQSFNHPNEVTKFVGFLPAASDPYSSLESGQYTTATDLDDEMQILLSSASLNSYGSIGYPEDTESSISTSSFTELESALPSDRRPKFILSAKGKQISAPAEGDSTPRSRMVHYQAVDEGEPERTGLDLDLLLPDTQTHSDNSLPKRTVLDLYLLAPDRQTKLENHDHARRALDENVLLSGNQAHLEIRRAPPDLDLLLRTTAGTSGSEIDFSKTSDTIQRNNTQEPASVNSLSSTSHFEPTKTSPTFKASDSLSAPHNKLSCRERKRIGIPSTRSPKLTQAMRSWIRQTHALLDPFREDDDCWFHPSPPPARRSRLSGALRSRGKIQKTFVWQDQKGRHSLVFNYGIVSKLVYHKLTKQQKDGLINRQWHLSHLCGNWTCLNPAHTTVEPGSVNISRNNCFSHRGGCLHDPPCMKNMKVALGADGKPVDHSSSELVGQLDDDDWQAHHFDDDDDFMGHESESGTSYHADDYGME